MISTAEFNRLKAEKEEKKKKQREEEEARKRREDNDLLNPLNPLGLTNPASPLHSIVFSPTVDTSTPVDCSPTTSVDVGSCSVDTSSF